MHGQVVQPQQMVTSGLGQAVAQATTMGLILAIPQQAYYLNTNTPRPIHPLDTCPSCGHQHPSGDKYCSGCGIRLQCQSCGTASWGKNFCHNCGQSL